MIDRYTKGGRVDEFVWSKGKKKKIDALSGPSTTYYLQVICLAVQYGKSPCYHETCTADELG
jgi:hypothetical protein